MKAKAIEKNQDPDRKKFYLKGNAKGKKIEKEGKNYFGVGLHCSVYFNPNPGGFCACNRTLDHSRNYRKNGGKEPFQMSKMKVLGMSQNVPESPSVSLGRSSYWHHPEL